MSEHFFEITSPRGMFEKARREFDRMQTTPTVDSIFNFFVTAYHVMDYVKTDGTVSESVRVALYSDPDFEMCQFICNKGKHLKLNKVHRYETKRKPGAVWGQAMWGQSRFNEAPSYIISIDGKQEIDVLDLGARVLMKWEMFLSDNGL